MGKESDRHVFLRTGAPHHNLVATALLLACILVMLMARAAGGQSEAISRISWYGYFKLDMAHDSAASSHGNYSLYVKPHDERDATSTLNVTARQSRLGMRVVRGTMKGRMEVDFYGVSPENENALMLRYAFIELPIGPLQLQAGQSSDLISPLVPSTINYSVVWGAGNIGYRRPQVKVYRQTDHLLWGLALGRNITGDLDGDTIVDGATSGVPSVQGRIAVNGGVGGMELQAGTSAHYGKCNCPAKDIDYNNWSVSGDLKVVVSPRLTALGEGYVGSNLGSYGGGIFNSDVVNGMRSRGGWANLQYAATPEWTFSLGGGLDDVDDEDLQGVTDARIENSVLFANGVYLLAPGAKVGMELSRWRTRYVNRTAGRKARPNDLRLQWSIQGDF